MYVCMYTPSSPPGICQVQKYDLSRNQLWLNRNQIGDVGVEKLAVALPSLTNLKLGVTLKYVFPCCGSRPLHNQYLIAE